MDKNKNLIESEMLTLQYRMTLIYWIIIHINNKFSIRKILHQSILFTIIDIGPNYAGN